MNFAPKEIMAMAKAAEAYADSQTISAHEWSELRDQRFAALVAAKERERIFGAGRQLDGQMRLQLTRWEDGECFVAAAHFNEEQTHCGGDDLLPRAVERLDDNLDACIAAAIRARSEKEGA